MKRRGFLGLVATGAAATAIGPWLGLGRAFADVSGSATERASALVEGMRRARRAGKPLLVLVIPSDPSAMWDRGGAYGELINHGSDEQLWPLALFEVACARLDAIRKLLPVEPDDPAQEPTLVVLEETDGGRWRSRALQATLPVHPSGMVRVAAVPGEKRPPTTDEISTARIAALAGLLQSAAATGTPGQPLSREWIARTSARLSSAERSAIARALSAGKAPSAALVERGASLVAAAALTDGPRAPLLARLVADSVLPRIRALPPIGSHWGSSSGCATTWEPTPEEIRQKQLEEERRRRAQEEAARRGEGLALEMQGGGGVGCGMGHVPEKGRRFLGFYTQGE